MPALARRRNEPLGNVKATRQDWLDLALAALCAEGEQQVTILNLSERLAVSRSSFYWYFKDRADLLDAILREWERLNTASILAQAEAPAETVGEAICNVFRCWTNPAIFSPRLDFAVREWSLRSKSVRAALDRADTARTEAIRRMFLRHGYEGEDALVRARVLYYMQIGYYALDIREATERRLALTPTYVEIFAGVPAKQSDIDAFRAYARQHASSPEIWERAK